MPAPSNRRTVRVGQEVVTRLRNGKYRNVEKSTGRLVRNKAGTPIDGGGFPANDADARMRAEWQGVVVTSKMLENGRRMITHKRK